MIVALPGAQSETVDAGGRIGRGKRSHGHRSVTVQPAFVDPEQTSVLDALVARVPPPGLDLLERGDTHCVRPSRCGPGGLAGHQATWRRRRGVSAGSTVLLALTEGGFVDMDGTPSQRAGLAVIIGGSVPEQVTEQTDADNDALVRLTGQLDARGRGTVVGGPPTASTEGGFLAAVANGGERSEGVSTVNTANAQRPAHREPGPAGAAGRRRW